VTDERVFDQLSPDLCERVLLRLGFARQPETSFDGLRALYSAWCRAVPFDNVRKLIHLGADDARAFPGTDAPEFFESLLRHGTGGTCWAGNGALCTLLATLGFRASRGLATMLAAPHLPPNHGTVIVELDGERYVVDASILHTEPLRLDDATTTHVAHPAWGARCAKQDDRWTIAWRPANRPEGLDCRIEEFLVTRASFRERYERTREWSPFNYELSLRVIRGERVLAVANGQRFEVDGHGLVTQQMLEHRGRERFLIEEVGLSEEIVSALPRDRVTPPPPAWWASAAPA